MKPSSQQQVLCLLGGQRLALVQLGRACRPRGLPRARAARLFRAGAAAPPERSRRRRRSHLRHPGSAAGATRHARNPRSRSSRAQALERSAPAPRSGREAVQPPRSEDTSDKWTSRARRRAERPTVEQTFELLVRGRPPAPWRRERPCRRLADRPERGPPCFRDHEVVAPTPRVNARAPVGGCASSPAAPAPGSGGALRGRPRARSRRRATRSVEREQRRLDRRRWRSLRK